VCSNDPQELLEWCIVNRTEIQSISGYCKKCNPEPVSNPITYADEIISPERFFEGAKTQIVVNSYERNLKARAECLRHHGVRCYVCEIDFESKYGDIGIGYIHVHHKIPLPNIGKEYEIDPKKDLIPVCPNCHTMLHRSDPPYEVEELRKMLK
jgi:5-methylcytosine-specific restriction protein A